MLANKIEFTQSEKKYSYILSDTESNETKAFTTNIEPKIMEALLAYIDFYSEDHYDYYWTMGDESMLKIINRFYSPVTYPISPENQKEPFKINRIENRNNFCGTDLWENKSFSRKMTHFMTKVINIEKLKDKLVNGEDEENELITDANRFLYV